MKYLNSYVDLMLQNIGYILFLYFVGLVLLTKFVDNKYEENYSKEITFLLLEDIFFISISGLISFYII